MGADSQEGERDEGERADDGECEEVQTAAASRPGRAHGYPYASVLFLLVVTVGQGYVSAGLQAVLEFYFVHFLYVCSGTERATSLGTTSVNVYIAIYQLCAISAGIWADKLIGNFLTQIFSVILTTSGICLLAFSTWQFSIVEPHCCYDDGRNASSWGYNCSELHKEVLLGSVALHIPQNVLITLAILGLVLYGIGYGHINTLQSVFVADQFREEQSESKRRSFSWFYLCCNLGALGGESGLPILRQSLGFVLAWITLLVSTAISTLIFLSGSCLYVRKKPQNGCCNGNNPNKLGSLNTDSEKTALLSKKDTTAPPAPVALLSWLRQLLPFLGVFGPMVVFWAVFYQQNTTWVVQGTHMDCHVGRLHVPPDLMPSVNDFLVVAIIPALEYIVYPHLEKTMRMKVQPLHKIIAGMTAAAVSFLMSGLLQIYVTSYHGDDCNGGISIAWQLPQLFFISIAEAIVCVTGLEFAYSQAPPQYRNLVTAMWYLSQALGTLLNAGVAQIPRMNLLQQFFMYTALMGVVTVVFSVINRRFRYRTPQFTANST